MNSASTSNRARKRRADGLLAALSTAVLSLFAVLSLGVGFQQRLPETIQVHPPAARPNPIRVASPDTPTRRERSPASRAPKAPAPSPAGESTSPAAPARVASLPSPPPPSPPKTPGATPGAKGSLSDGGLQDPADASFTGAQKLRWAATKIVANTDLTPLELREMILEVGPLELKEKILELGQVELKEKILDRLGAGKGESGRGPSVVRGEIPGLDQGASRDQDRTGPRSTDGAGRTVTPRHLRSAKPAGADPAPPATAPAQPSTAPTVPAPPSRGFRLRRPAGGISPRGAGSRQRGCERIPKALAPCPAS